MVSWFESLRRVQVATKDPLPQDLSAIVCHPTNDGRFGGDELVAFVHLEPRGVTEALVQLAPLVAVRPQHQDVSGAFIRSPVRAESARAGRLGRDASGDVPECPTTRRRPCRGDGRRPARSRVRTPAWRRRTDIAAAAKRRGRGLACGGCRRLHQLQCRGMCTIGVGSHGCRQLGRRLSTAAPCPCPTTPKTG